MHVGVLAERKCRKISTFARLFAPTLHALVPEFSFISLVSLVDDFETLCFDLLEPITKMDIADFLCLFKKPRKLW